MREGGGLRLHSSRILCGLWGDEWWRPLGTAPTQLGVHPGVQVLHLLLHTAVPATAPRACLPNRLTAGWKAWGVSRFQVFTNDQWARVEPLLPSSDGQRGRPFRNHRQVVEGIAYRYRCGIAWRDLPEQFGPWQTVWKRHRRFAADGIWDRIHAVLLTEADAAGDIDWTVSVDSTINRAHQHGTNLPRSTGGPAELQETLDRA
jgi:transposase